MAMFMDLTKFKHALAVAREGSYGAAAIRLNLSQPALSRSIQSLEAMYGLRIFERGRGGTRPTTAGADFLDIAASIVERAQMGEEQLRHVASGHNRIVSFGLGSITAGIILPELMPELARNGIRVRITIGSVSALQVQVRQGGIDFYISGLSVGTDHNRLFADYRIRRIPFTGLGLLVRRGHPLLELTPDPATLSAFPTACGSFLPEILPPMRMEQLGLQPLSVELDDYTMLAALARESDFLVIASRLLARARPELDLVPVPFHIPMDDVEWGLISTSRNRLSKTAEAVAALIFDRLAQSVAEDGKQLTSP